MNVTIQMKVYDEAGRRVAVEETTLPASVSAEDATAYVKREMSKLRGMKYPERLPINVEKEKA